jgi:hypothetical protein
MGTREADAHPLLVTSMLKEAAVMSYSKTQYGGCPQEVVRLPAIMLIALGHAVGDLTVGIPAGTSPSSAGNRGAAVRVIGGHPPDFRRLWLSMAS